MTIRNFKAVTQPQDIDNKQLTGTFVSYVLAVAVLSHAPMYIKYLGLSAYLLLPTKPRANERGSLRLWDTSRTQRVRASSS